MKKKIITSAILVFCICNFLFAQNPFESLGVKDIKVATLSNGRYNEFFDNDTIVQIGSVLFNTMTNKIEGFVETDTLYSEATLEPEIISRWLSPDPLAAKMPNWSPYNFVKGNPILMVDPDGAFPYSFHVRSFHPDATFGGGFMGDNRGYSNNPNASARIGQHFTFDPSTGQTSNKGFQNSFSLHPAGFVSSVAGQVPLPSSMFIDKDSPHETNYDVAGGNGSYNISTGYAGKNPLTPGFLTPDVDVHSAFSITEDKKNGFLTIGASIKGDDFPSSEAFVVDQSGNSVFIGVSSLSGNVLKSLWGDNYRDMIKQGLNISIDNKGNFTGVKVGDKNVPLNEWNKNFETQPTK